MIDLVYKVLLSVMNKENRGYVTPEEFNTIISLVTMEIFRSYFEDENRDKTRFQMNRVGKGYSNLAFNQRQMITQFSEVTTSPTTASSSPSYVTVEVPSDLYFFEQNGISDQNGRVIDEVERNSVARMLGTEVAPSETYPIYENYGDSIHIYPATVEDVTVRYIRTPKNPKWTYTIISDSPLYNPTLPDFQDIELHESEFSNIVLRMLSYFGINMREEAIMQIAEILKDKQNLKDNS